MRVCIILNGEIKNYDYIKSIVNKNNYDYIICADGGANHSYNMDITPDYIIGDLDSISSKIVEFYKSKDVKFEKFPSKKDETDTEICVYLANRLNAKEIDFIGALGGRLDHMIANINLLYYVRNKGIYTKIISEDENIYIAINEEIIINGDIGDTISVIPLNGDAKGVTLKKLEYPLKNYDMKFSLPLGISNVMLDKKCSIKVEKGSLIIIKNTK